MASLSNNQVNIINDLIVQNGVHLNELKIDIIDHICCMVEKKMDSGMDFRESLTLSTQ